MRQLGRGLLRVEGWLSEQPGEPDHIELGGPHTVWCQWTPTADVTVAVGTCGSPSYSGASVYASGPVSSPAAALGMGSGCANGTRAAVSSAC